jgi:hypothetical protein
MRSAALDLEVVFATGEVGPHVAGFQIQADTGEAWRYELAGQAVQPEVAVSMVAGRPWAAGAPLVLIFDPSTPMAEQIKQRTPPASGLCARRR